MLCPAHREAYKKMKISERLAKIAKDKEKKVVTEESERQHRKNAQELLDEEEREKNGVKKKGKKKRASNSEFSLQSLERIELSHFSEDGAASIENREVNYVTSEGEEEVLDLASAFVSVAVNKCNKTKSFVQQDKCTKKEAGSSFKKRDLKPENASKKVQSDYHVNNLTKINKNEEGQNSSRYKKNGPKASVTESKKPGSSNFQTESKKPGSSNFKNAKYETERNGNMFNPIKFDSSVPKRVQLAYEDDIPTWYKQKQPQPKFTAPRFMKPEIVNPEGYLSVWVGNVEPETTEKQLFDLFSTCGVIGSIKMMPEKYCAFINYRDKYYAALAMNSLQGTLLNGQNLLLQFPLTAMYVPRKPIRN